VSDKAKPTVVAALDVQTDPPVDGRWHWVSSQLVHWRPETYWATGTKITATAKMLGVDLGGGTYGRSNTSLSFTIGPARIAVADSNTHRMIVTVDGTQVKNFPISMGKGGYATGTDGKPIVYNGQPIDFWTRSGPHVVLQKTPTTRMDSASYGVTDPTNPNFYDETVYLTVRISYAGEFMHSAPWNMPAHGHYNSSHGCINLDPNDAQWVYDNFQIGDVVVVKNTPKPLPLYDGLGDWNVAWTNW
jgi:lipoprotein-anchoring transpeptidase ErfK/SrfK